MSIKAAFAPVGTAQKVAGKPKEAETKTAFTVSWSKTSAMIGQTVGITGTANILIKDASLVSVGILFNGGQYAVAESVKVTGKQITAQWKVKPFKAGNFTNGSYDAEIRYNGSVPGRTTAALKIVAGVPSGDFFG